MAEGIDKTIWRARKRLLDLADEVREIDGKAHYMTDGLFRGKARMIEID